MVQMDALVDTVVFLQIVVLKNLGLFVKKAMQPGQLRIRYIFGGQPGRRIFQPCPDKESPLDLLDVGGDDTGPLVGFIDGETFMDQTPDGAPNRGPADLQLAGQSGLHQFGTLFDIALDDGVLELLVDELLIAFFHNRWLPPARLGGPVDFILKNLISGDGMLYPRAFLAAASIRFNSSCSGSSRGGTSWWARMAVAFALASCARRSGFWDHLSWER